MKALSSIVAGLSLFVATATLHGQQAQGQQAQGGQPSRQTQIGQGQQGQQQQGRQGQQGQQAAGQQGRQGQQGQGAQLRGQQGQTQCQEVQRDGSVQDPSRGIISGVVRDESRRTPISMVVVTIAGT